MSPAHIKKVVIVGGGTAGWISAAALSRLLGTIVDITLIESEAIGTVGVGEATIPQIRRLNAILGLDENEFIRETKGTFKLGIEFSNWGEKGERYLHTFGDIGLHLGGVPFHHYWLRKRAGGAVKEYWTYSLHHKAAYDHKFARVDRVGNTSMTGLAYAFHFDAGLYARYLRKYSEARGAKRIEGIVESVQQQSETGFITGVTLKSGEQIDGDLFIDCTGFRALLMDGALGVGFEDWSHWLPCNSAVTVGCEPDGPLLPYTKSIAHDAGWQWRIPLQHRIGNGHVFCDGFTDTETAADILVNNLDGAPIGEPRSLKFRTGRRQKLWHKNCVAIGLSSGFLEPLESTSIHLIQSQISKLIELFPTTDFAQADIAEYNRRAIEEFDLVRDFLILHYKLTRREDSDFWRYCKNMDIPDTLQAKMDLFAAAGRIFHAPDDLFRDASWIQVMMGQGLVPKAYHAMADAISEAQLSELLQNVETLIQKTVSPLPSHQTFIDNICEAN